MLRRTNRLRDAALVIPIGGVVLFLPPYVLIFDQDGYFFGIPFLHVALFTCWLVGLVLTGVMSRLLLRSSTTAPNAIGLSATGPEEAEYSIDPLVTGDGSSEDVSSEPWSR